MDIHLENRDRRSEAYVLGNLGLAYSYLGQWQKAIEHYDKALQIFREFEDPRGEAFVLAGIGGLQVCLGKAEQAIECFDKAVVIQRRIGDPRGEGLALADIACAYGKFGQATRAIEYSTKALELFRRTKDRRHEGQVLGDLGNALAQLGQGEEAIEQYEKALEVHRETRNRMNEASVLWDLGKTYKQRSADSLALNAFRAAHAIEMTILAGVERSLEESTLQSLGSKVFQGGVVEYFQLLVKLLRSEEPLEEKEALLREALDLAEVLSVPNTREFAPNGRFPEALEHGWQGDMGSAACAEGEARGCGEEDVRGASR